MQTGVIGNGSWATALVKMLTDNHHKVNWWIRNEDSINYIRNRRHNPHYLSNAYFDTSLLNMQNDVQHVVAASDLLVMAVPSAYMKDVLQQIDSSSLKEKRSFRLLKDSFPARMSCCTIF